MEDAFLLLIATNKTVISPHAIAMQTKLQIHDKFIRVLEPQPKDYRKP